MGPISARETKAGRSRPEKTPPVWAGPGPDRWVGPDLVWPIKHKAGPKKNAGPGSVWPSYVSLSGEINSHLVLHAERSFCMQGKELKWQQLRGGEEITWRGGDDGLLAVLLWRWWQCRGLRTAGQAALQLFPTDRRRSPICCFCFGFLSFLSASNFPKLLSFGF